MRNALLGCVLACALSAALVGCSAHKEVIVSAPSGSAGSADGPSAPSGSVSSADAGDADAATEEDESGSETPDSQRRRVQKRGDASVQQQLEESVAQFEKSNATASSIRAMLSLARFYRLHRRMKASVATLEKAYSASKQLGDSDSEIELKGVTCAQLGDAYMRTNRMHEALGLYEQAMALLPEGSDDGECKLRMYPRIAWALRRSGDTKQASLTAQRAAAEAKKSQGETSPLYRVAITEMAVIALDKQDQKQFGKFQKQLDELPTRNKGPFAKVFLRSCARQCKHDQQPEQAMFVDQQARYFMTK